MAPDLSSISPSRTSNSSSPLAHSQSASQPSNGEATPPPQPPRSPSFSLAAAASMNAAERSRRLSHTNGQGPGSPQAARVAERRRSQVAMNLNLNDPTIPGPGELATSDARHSPSYGATGHFTLHSGGDPHHQRAPSLGEIHQELEQEQEAQVNRLLAMIRQQQAQLNSMQQAQQQGQGSGAVDDSTPTSERSISFPPMPPAPAPGLRSSSSVRRTSRRSSQNATSPALRPMPSFSHTSSEIHGSNGASNVDLPSPAHEQRTNRDEAAFYQAEATSLTRENQMLRNRIRELERQVHDLTFKQEHAPASHSNLVSAPVENESDITSAASAETATPAATTSTQTEMT